MAATFSLVYPTRHRPDFIRQALRILERQRHASFEVVVSDNYLDPALSCEQICHESPLANLRYVRPPSPVGMVDNWNHALQFATGDYIAYLTDKMFVLPGALGRIERAIDVAHRPDIVSWTSDFYNPVDYADYFGEGQYVGVLSDVRLGQYRAFSPVEELHRRGRADVSRPEQSSSAYCRGKVVFGCYGRDMVDRVVRRFGALFHDINPDYTSMVLGFTEARDAVELADSCVVSVNTDISNGMLCDTDDAAALAFLDTLAGGAASVLPNMLVPGLYVSLHNWVAHDYLSLKSAYDLDFTFNAVNWVAYCSEDVHRPGRRWSSPRIETEQKGLLRTLIESLEPEVAAAVHARISERAAPKPARPSLRRLLPRRSLRPLLPRWWRRKESTWHTSIQAAVESSVAGGEWAD